MHIRISGTVDDSIVDGPGYRYAIFTQGCPHGCPGCHNPQTHDPAGGKDADTDDLLTEILDNPLLAGVTFSGGDPFLQPRPLTDLAAKIKELSSLDIWCYTGYTLEELQARHDADTDRLLSYVDVLVDGRFIESRRDISLAFRGSRNQRLIDMNATRETGRITLWKES